MVLKPWGAFDVAREIAQAKVSGLTIDSIWKYCLLEHSIRCSIPAWKNTIGAGSFTVA